MRWMHYRGVRHAISRFRVCAIALVALAFSVNSKAEIVFYDEVLEAYLEAGRNIAADGDRGASLVQLRQVIRKYPQSPNSNSARRLAEDLAESITRAEFRARSGRAIAEAPAEFLSETRLPSYLLWTDKNGAQPLDRFMKWHPHDPAVLLLRQGRTCIDQLLPQLANNSPTRIESEGFSGTPAIPRVSGVALELIEAVSLCKFHHPGMPQETPDELIAHISKWWVENRNKSVAEGIRAQLPHGDSYSMLTMAQNLMRLAGETDPQNRAHGLEALRRIARAADDYGAPAAHALAIYGDLSPLEWYYADLKSAVEAKGRLWDHRMGAIWYLAEHGRQKEWELLQAIAVDDIESANKGKSWGRHAYVLGSLINARHVQTSPFAIPLLGMALSDTEVKGSRWINEEIGGQSFSKADQATEYLQKLTGVEFGYLVEGTQAERRAAIELAQKWWTEKGKAQYTFDYIERNMAKPARQGQ